MIEDATLRLRCQDRVWEYFGARMRGGLKRLLEAFMEYERDQMLGCDPYERTASRKGYRNGFHRRRLDTCWGEPVVRSPKSWERATWLVWRKLETAGYAPTSRPTTKSVFTPIS